MAALGYLIVAGAVMGLLGLAGWRYGFALSAAVLAGGTATLTYRGLQPGQERGLWTATAVVASVVVAGVLVDVSPPSREVLAQRMNSLGLPYRRVSERESGHSWCIPGCPVVEAVFRAPPVNPRGPMVDAISALARHHFLDHNSATKLLAGLSTHLTASSGRVHVDVSAESMTGAGGDWVRLDIRLAGRR